MQRNARTSRERSRNKHKASEEAVAARDAVLEETRLLGRNPSRLSPPKLSRNRHVSN